MTKMGLTPKQKQLFDFIRMYQKEKGQSPSYDEMLVGVGGKARESIKMDHILGLLGYLITNLLGG